MFSFKWNVYPLFILHLSYNSTLNQLSRLLDCCLWLYISKRKIRHTWNKSQRKAFYRMKLENRRHAHFRCIFLLLLYFAHQCQRKWSSRRFEMISIEIGHQRSFKLINEWTIPVVVLCVNGIQLPKRFLISFSGFFYCLFLCEIVTNHRRIYSPLRIVENFHTFENCLETKDVFPHNACKLVVGS